MKYAPYYPATPTPLEILRIKDASLFWIAIAVLIAHFLLVLLSFYSSSETVKPTSRQQVVVKTVQLNPQTKSLSPVNPMASQKAGPVSDKPVTQQPLPEPIPEVKTEPKKIEVPTEAPPVLPIKAEEPIVVPEPEPLPPPTPPPPPPKPEPEVIKEQPPTKPPVATPKKTETSKPAEKKPKVESKPKPDPKATPAKKTDSKPAKKANQAPVKKTASETKKPKTEPKKGPTAEEIAAKEAEKVRQKEIAEAQVKQRELLAKAKENLAKIGESRDKIGSGSFSNKISSLNDTTIPQQLGNLQIDALPVGTALSGELSAKEASYRDEIAMRLKIALSLPDYGAVKLKLILNRSGKVESVQILNSESHKNKQYVEKTVPSLIFPPFGNRFGDASQYSFVVTLNNDH